MAFTIPVQKISFGGSLPAGEVWQCGLWFSPNTTPGTQAALQAEVDAMVTPFTTWWATSAISGIRAAGMTLNNLSLYGYAANATSAGAVAHATISLAANATQQSKPNQCALVCSLRTVSPARNGRGRIYLPFLSGGVAGGQLATTDAQAVATATANLLVALNGGTAPSSIGRVLGGTSGLPVTSVVVDTVIDTQRRRRNKIVATGSMSSPVN